MQVEITLTQLIRAARLGRKADAAMLSGANVAMDVRGAYRAALEHNESQSDTIPNLVEADVFVDEWTASRRSAELQEHIVAMGEIKALAESIGVEL